MQPFRSFTKTGVRPGLSYNKNMSKVERRCRRVLIPLFRVLPALILPLLAFAEADPTPSATPSFNPLCFIYGVAERVGGPTKGFEAIGGQIRLRLDAATETECRAEAEAYCKISMANKDFLLKRLDGYFRESSQSSKRTYQLNSRCEFTWVEQTEK